MTLYLRVKELKKEIRRLIKPKAHFQCERCGKTIKNAGLYEHRSPQYISDHLPEIKRVCRNCVYIESFGSKGLNARKKKNQIEEQSELYMKID